MGLQRIQFRVCSHRQRPRSIQNGLYGFVRRCSHWPRQIQLTDANPFHRTLSVSVGVRIPSIWCSHWTATKIEENNSLSLNCKWTFRESEWELGFARKHYSRLNGHGIRKCVFHTMVTILTFGTLLLYGRALWDIPLLKSKMLPSLCADEYNNCSVDLDLRWILMWSKNTCFTQTFFKHTHNPQTFANHSYTQFISFPSHPSLHYLKKWAYPLVCIRPMVI